MNVVWAALIVIAAAAVAITAMLVVRRRAPEGSFFADGDRAGSIFGVVATGFSVLLGFLIFLVFESYDASRSGAEAEALIIAQQIQTAQLMPPAVREDLTGELVCYARSVVHGEWARMEEGSLGEDINPWGVAMFGTVRDVELGTPNEETAYGMWLDQTSAREEARQARIHGAAGLMPTPLWIALFFMSAIVLSLIFGFADSGERAWVQAMFIGAVVSVVTTLLLLLAFLDDPFHSGIGGLQPVAMERAVVLIEEQLDVLGGDIPIPCDEQGIAR
jgi:hypothetical protein